MVYRRPGSGPQSNYITLAGYQKLREELDELWTVERPAVTQQVADAAALGDRSENAEYIYGKKRLREIDKRVHFLSKRLEVLVVVTPPAKSDGVVRFGAWVTLEDEDGELLEYRIVGPDEFDAKANLISLDAPVAKALIGKRIDDDVVVIRPKGKIIYTLVGIRYSL